MTDLAAPRSASGGTPLPLRLILAIAAGLGCWLAFPSHNLAPLAWIGTGLLSYAGWAAGARRGFLIGLVAGWAYFVPTLSWSGIYVGKLPWGALATLEALYVAVMVAVVAALQRRLLARGLGWAAYACVPLGWVVGEWARSTTPFGGFPWARLAFSQADAPIAHLAAYGGAPLVTAAVATLGVLGHAGIAGIGGLRAAALPLGAAALLAAGPMLLPLPTDGQAARIGLVQGNVPRPGLDFNAERRAVLDNHVVGTETLGRAERNLDLVVWPENASDIDPLRNPDAAAQIQRALRAVDAPLLVGAILDEPEPAVSNASLLYRVGSIEPERYIKQHPVPFAEYIPYRTFFRAFSDKVDLVRAGFAKGTGPVAFDLETRTGSAVRFAALPTICFEVAYDGLLRDSVKAAGSTPSVLIVQTNNATFGFTAESEQQFAISRLRAIEHGRSVVHVSTVGVSGFVAPDGSVGQTSALFTAYGEAKTVPVRSGLTVADRLGPTPEYAAAAALLVLAAAGRRRRRGGHNESAIPPNRVSKELLRA